MTDQMNYEMSDQQLPGVPSEPSPIKDPTQSQAEDKAAILKRIEADFSSPPEEVLPAEYNTEDPPVIPPEKSPLGQRVIQQFMDSIRFREGRDFREKLETAYEDTHPNET
jgi:hypothetical protein